jgi:hypothetical protein
VREQISKPQKTTNKNISLCILMFKKKKKKGGKTEDVDWMVARNP